MTALVFLFAAEWEQKKFEYVFNRYRRLMLHKAYEILRDYALAEDAASLYFLGKSKSRDVHIKATQIFTSNDVFVNIGVIVAAVFGGAAK